MNDDTNQSNGWDHFVKGLVKVAGYGFAALVLLFTGIQTYTLLSNTEGIGVYAPLGIVLFGGGMWYWWMVFRKEAGSWLQLALAGIMFVFSLLMEIAAVSLHLGAVSLTFFGPHTPAIIITVAALLNLAAKLFYPIFSAEEWAQITERANLGETTPKMKRGKPQLNITKPEAKAIPAGRPDEVEVIPVYPNGREEMSVLED